MHINYSPPKFSVLVKYWTDVFFKDQPRRVQRDDRRLCKNQRSDILLQDRIRQVNNELLYDFCKL